jgi:hypothetical protein
MNGAAATWPDAQSTDAFRPMHRRNVYFVHCSALRFSGFVARRNPFGCPTYEDRS